MGQGQQTALLPPGVKAALTILLVTLAIAAFAAIVGAAIYQTWTAPRGDTPDFDEGFLYVANALMALVGGVVAVAFGQPAPHENPQPRLQVALVRGLSFRGTSTKTRRVDAVAVLATIYVTVYVLLGIAAVLTLGLRNDTMPDLLRALAFGFIGMGIGIIAGFFTRPD